MPKPTKGARLGGSPAHEKLMLANLATALFEHGRITTTETKAKRLRPFAERLITKAKRGDLHARRQVMAVIRRKDIVHTLFTEIGPSQAGRPGGYTRITKVGPRKGDSAPLAVIEIVEAMTEAPASSSSSSSSSSSAESSASAETEKPAAKKAATKKAASKKAAEEPAEKAEASTSQAAEGDKAEGSEG